MKNPFATGRAPVARLPAPAFTYRITCRDSAGCKKWREDIHNIVTTAGKNDLINQYFKGASYTAAWYLGLCGAGSVSAADTMASHNGWAEITPYAGNRPAISWGTTTGAANIATPVSFIITATAATVAGAFITSSNAAGGTGGVLYSASDFSVLRTVAGGDTLTVTPTVSFS